MDVPQLISMNVPCDTKCGCGGNSGVTVNVGNVPTFLPGSNYDRTADAAAIIANANKKGFPVAQGS